MFSDKSDNGSSYRTLSSKTLNIKVCKPVIPLDTQPLDTQPIEPPKDQKHNTLTDLIFPLSCKSNPEKKAINQIQNKNKPSPSKPAEPVVVRQDYNSHKKANRRSSTIQVHNDIKH